nr:ABC transporter permease [Bosea caraganae]
MTEATKPLRAGTGTMRPGPSPIPIVYLKLWQATKFVGGIALTILCLMALTFFIGRVMPSDPALHIVGQDADQETYRMVYERLGLDQPIIVQFWRYLTQLAHGDFGVALLTGRPVIDDIARVFPATVELATLSIIFGAGIGIPLGVVAAVNKGKWIDHLVRLVSLTGHSIPIFWLGMMGLLVFYGMLGWLGGPGEVDVFYNDMVERRTGMLLIDSLIAGEMDVFWNAVSHIVLPASVLGYSSMAYISRMTRSFMLAQLNQEYAVTARVKGLSESKVIWRHVFRNIRVQLVTIVALTYGSLLEGAVLVEKVFAWPGFGQYLTNNLLFGDMNAIMLCVTLVGIIFIGLNILSDALYRVFDPRTRT